jgi:membrane protein DedA with SNARE-associated domain
VSGIHVDPAPTTFLALAEIVLVAVSGAMIGDQIGFVVGRWFVFRAPARRLPNGE